MDHLKKKHIKSRLQAIVFTENGFLLESCDTLFSLQEKRNTSIFEIFPFFRRQIPLLRRLNKGVIKRFTQVDIDYDSKNWVVDFSFGKEGNNFFCVVEDFTDLYHSINSKEDKPLTLEGVHLQKELENLRKMQKLKQDQFSSITHDIKLPLTEIIGTTHLLQHFVDNEKGRAYLKALSNSARNLDTMLNDLVTFSKSEAFNFRIESRAFDIKQLIKSVVKSFEFKARENQVPILLHLDAAIPPNIVGDATRISQIIYNLVDNAIKFTAEGHIDVQVLLQDLSEDFCRLSFKIKDTGVGIPSDSLNAIFETYQQVNAERDSSRGFGIGLSIVKQLVELQDGRIEAKSQLGAGSSFNVSIPFGRVAS